MTAVLIVFGILILGMGMIAIYAISIYNRLIALRNRFRNAYAQIDVQLKRRYDLIPNIVETAKAYMKHEKETLEAVIQARNQASQMNQQAANAPENANAIKDLMGAEGALTGLLTKFFALSEAYPDLKANQQMQHLHEELTSTENKVSFARQAYNDSVMAYNTSRESFPAVLIAGALQFQPAQSFEITNIEEREAPKVAFN